MCSCNTTDTNQRQNIHSEVFSSAKIIFQLQIKLIPNTTSFC